jgi:hypothetical protein
MSCTIFDEPISTSSTAPSSQVQLTFDRFAISGMQVAIHQISVGNDEFHSESGRKLDSILQKLSMQTAQTDALVSSTSLLNEKMGQLNLSDTRGFKHSPERPLYDFDPAATDSKHKTSPADSTGMIQVRASCYRKTCRPWCSCCCHVRRSARSPDLVKGFIGSLFVGYSGVPLATQPCNERQCRRRSTLRFILSYQFPAWFWTRALFASFTTANVPGPEMLIRVQTKIPYASEIYQHCLNGNAESLQRLFQERAASPFDVDPDGLSLLHVRADRFRQPPSHAKY